MFLQKISWIVIITVLLVTSFSVHLLQALSYVLIRPFSLDVYRKFNYYVTKIIFSFGPFAFKNIAGGKFRLYMTDEDRKKFDTEHKLVIINHTVEFDFLIPVFAHHYLGGIGGIKTFSKISSKYIPVFGWTGFFTDYIFLYRNYSKDAKIIEDGMQTLLSYPSGYWNTLYLPAEGTRFNKEKHEVSVEMAKSKSLPPLKHHLLPRTKGFCCAIQSTHEKLKAVYDFTYVTEGEKKVTLMNMLRGHDFTFHARIKRIDINEIPKTEEELVTWLHKLYQEKDRLVDHFLAEKMFDLPLQEFSPTYNDVIIVILSSLFVLPLLTYLTWSIFVGSTSLKLIVLAVTISLILVFKVMLDQVSMKHTTKFNKKDSDETSFSNCSSSSKTKLT